MSQLDKIINRIKEFNEDDINMMYIDPTENISKPRLTERRANNDLRISMRMPARLNSPLINTGNLVQSYIDSGFPVAFTGLEQNTLNYLHTIGNISREISSKFKLPPKKFRSSMESFLYLMHSISGSIKVRPGSEMDSLIRTADNYAMKLTEIDIKHAMMRDEVSNDFMTCKVDIPPILILLMRSRAAMTRGIEQQAHNGYDYHDTSLNTDLHMDKAGWTIINDHNKSPSWIIMFVDRWACAYVRSSATWVIVPMTYMDYYFTKVEILYNMDIVSSTDDYKDIRELVELLKYLASMGSKHDSIVDFMKSFEGLLNMTADFKADDRCSVGSIIDVYNSMSEIDKSISGVTIQISDYLTIAMSGLSEANLAKYRRVNYSILYLLAKAIANISPSRLLEVSSLHKFCFYAVIDEDLGVKKLAKRTHTGRDIDYTAIRTMRCYFNREYFIEFTRKHKRMPQVLMDEDKISKSDVVPELETTEFDSIENKYKVLIVEYKKYGKISRDTHPLHWWYNIRPYDCEEDLTVGTPIEHSKDKRSAKEKGSYSCNDTEKELERIIRSESISFRQLHRIISEKVIESRVEYIQQGSRTYYDDLTTILKEKEREQKKEGRLFGMLTTEGKQSLSKMMTKAEHVLSYFAGNLMTPSDSQRKKTLHWMAQSLIDDDKYAIMADIEGHNQSMQHGNTADLLESIGMIYGEFGWGKLARLFSNLNLFYAYTFEDYAFLSKGQLGGIEGWMNPVWTLHTVIVTSLLPEITGVEVRSKAVYSDDIAIVTVLPELTDQTLNATLRQTQAHFYRFGMILKSLQTVVSKCRITMLRQHYINGIRSDSSLKRMIAVSSMGNQYFHCDEIECAGLASAISSSLELSNHIYPQVFLKWTRISHLLIRSFLSSIMTKISPALMTTELFNEGTVSIYKSLFDYHEYSGSSWIYDRLRSDISSMSPEKAIEWIKLQKNMLSIKPLSESQRESAKYQILRLAREDSSIFVLFVVRCLLPVDMGGVNAMVLEQMILTGFRDSVSRTLSILKCLFKSDTKESKIVNICLMNVLGGNGRFTQRNRLDDEKSFDLKIIDDDLGDEIFTVDYDESSLATQEWPTSLRQITPESLIKGKLMSLFKKICVNKELKSLLMFDDFRGQFRCKIVDELRDNFYSKIARFYIDVSGFMIVDKILSKVENTSSMIKRVKDFPRLCTNLAQCAIKGPRKWLLEPIYNYGEITPETNLQEYLFTRRSRMFPKINFVRCIEPEANSTIKECPIDNRGKLIGAWSMQCTAVSGMSTVEGKSRYLPPLYGNEALYKGDLKDRNEMFSSLTEALLVQCISVTKWIIYRSDEKNYSKNIILSNNITNCADLSLATLSYGRFRTYQAYVPLLTRSEIAHRIPVLDQKPKAVLRCLPSQSTKYKVTFNQSWVVMHDLADSDIHFDYYKMRLICAQSVSSSMHEPMKWSGHYYVKLNPLIRDVRYNYLSDRKEIDLTSVSTIRSNSFSEVPVSRIIWIANALPTIMDGGSVSSMPKYLSSQDGVSVATTLSKQLIIEYYKSLKSQNLWDYNPLWSDKAWRPFISKYERSLESEIILNAENIKVVIQDHVLENINAMRTEMSLSTSRELNKSIIDLISKEILSDDNNVIDSCDAIIGLLSSLSKLARNRPDDMIDTTEIVNMYDNHNNRLIKELFLRIIIENCLVVKLVNGRIDIDIFASEAICEEMIQDLVMFIGPDSPQTLVAGLITRRLNRDELRVACTMVIDQAHDLISTQEVEFEVPESIITKIKYEDVEKIDPDNVELPMRETSRFYMISNENGYPVSNISKLAEFRSKLVSNYGDPSIYDSPLCSDIYVTAYSLLFGMEYIGLIDSTVEILDLTAGRGEFSIAMNKLDLKGQSISRHDQYSAMKSSSSVRYIDDYDWASDQAPDEYYSIKSLVRDKRICLIFDLSHVGKDRSKFVDRLLDIMLDAETIVVRQKIISDDISRVCESCYSNGYRLYICLIGDAARLSPVSYYVITRREVQLTKLSNVDQSLLFSTRVIKDIRSLLNYKVPESADDDLNSCSLYEDFDLVNINDRRIGELLSVAVNKGDAKVKHELLSKSQIVCNYYIPDMVFNHMPDESKERITNISIGQINEIEDLLNYGYKMIYMGQQQWQKPRNHPSGRIVPAYRLDRADLAILRSTHPVSSLRNISHLLFRAELPININDDENFEVIVSHDINSSILKLAHWGPRSRNFYNAVLLLIGNSMHQSKSLHRDILRLNYQLNTISRRNYYELSRYVNMLTPLQNRFDEYLSNWAVNEGLGRLAAEEYYDQFVRKLYYSDSYRLSIKHDSNNQIIRPEERSNKDEELARLFLEGIDKVVDIDFLSNNIISDSSKNIVLNDDVFNIEQINRIMNAGIIGVIGDVASVIEINSEVLKEDDEREERLRGVIERNPDEDDDEYNRRVRMISLISGMNDDLDPFMDDDDEW